MCVCACVHTQAEMNGNPFLLTLKTTFKDATYLYMLLELCQGGELFSRLLEVRLDWPCIKCGLCSPQSA